MNLILILSSVILNCLAQLFMRKGMLDVGTVALHSLVSQSFNMLSNIWLWIAMFCYAVSVFLWMVVLSKVEVSYAYPFLSVGYVLAAVAGYFFFSESLTLMRILGIFIICVGVYIISRS